MARLYELITASPSESHALIKLKHIKLIWEFHLYFLIGEHKKPWGSLLRFFGFYLQFWIPLKETVSQFSFKFPYCPTLFYALHHVLLVIILNRNIVDFRSIDKASK